MIGETLSHFKITAKLGQGGMGVVYRGIDLDLDRPVAIKVLPPEAQLNEDSVARFLREAKTASKLQHPAITTIYEFGVKDKLRYLVMEFIDGKTLKQILKTGSLPVRQLLEIAIQVADALTLAGEKAIVHRDIKAENIMLTDRGQVKILDFGLAKMVEKTGPVAPDHFQTMNGVVMGTITHMSPEQALGAEVDSRTDIYSTGVVLFEMATGQIPFSGASANVVLAKILNQPPPPASELNPELPPSLEKVIRKCLEKNREQRYQSASGLLMDLKTIKHEVERTRDWSGTVVMPAAKVSPPVENLRELIPGTPSPAAGTPAPLPTPPSGTPRMDTTAIRRAVAEAKKEPSRALRLAVPPVAALLKVIRKTIGWAGGVYAFACMMLFAMSLLTLGQLRSLAEVVPWLRGILQPGLDVAGSLLPFPLIFGDANFLPLAVGVIVYLAQLGVCTGLERLEGLLRKSVERKGPTAAAAIQFQHQRLITPASASRMSLLREYAVAKRMLSEAQREMAFLAVDVVGSTKMKLGEDKITIEHAFAEYKKFLERIFREYRVYKLAWTPDGVMACFPSVEDAVAAARKIIAELEWFNRGDIHQLRGKFRVRCGINAGVVLIPEEKPLEEISDHTIDVAGHLQKEAEPDTLWVSGDVHGRLVDRNGFTRLDTQVDGHEVFAWRKLV
jgi:class 3 adenylate cyclase/predicted Ser/Thr protein kinase